MRARSFSQIIISLFCGFMYSCSSASDEPNVIEQDKKTYLILKVSTADAVLPQSRSYSFEPASMYENINTMRFIVVGEDGTVDAIDFVENKAGVNHVTSNPLAVKPYETKRIFLIGNEESLPEDILSEIKQLRFNDRFPHGNLELNKTIDLPQVDGEYSPLYTANQYIPITEIQSYYIAGPQYFDNGDPKPYSVDNLFANRIATKFEFTLTVSDTYLNIPPESVTIDQIATSEYLFPHDTEYFLPNPANLGNRLVTAYSVPPYVENVPFSIKWKSTDSPNKYITGAVYLPETESNVTDENGDQVYNVTLRINGEDLTAPLTNLPSLPRNSYVKVSMTLQNDASLECTTTVVPYISVVLEPSFGFWEINPNQNQN